MQIRVPKDSEWTGKLEKVVGMAFKQVNSQFKDNPLLPVNFQLKNARRCSLTLRVTHSDRPPARQSVKGRRLIAANWAAHRDFMRAVFAIVPHAVIQTSVTTYYGATHFEDTFEATACFPVGGAIERKRLGDL